MKKSQLCKILAVIFFVLLFAVVLTVSVGAQEHTVPAGDAAALQSTIASAAAGDTIPLGGGGKTISGAGGKPGFQSCGAGVETYQLVGIGQTEAAPANRVHPNGGIFLNIGMVF